MNSLHGKNLLKLSQPPAPVVDQLQDALAKACSGACLNCQQKKPS